MAKRRNLKKQLNYIADITVGLCLMEAMNANSERRKEIDNIISEFFDFHFDIISRISHTEPGNVKGFYKKLREDFNSKLEEVFNKLREK